MTSLYDYMDKTVIVKTKDGRTYKGLVDFFEEPYQNESKEESFGILTSPGFGIEFYASEIESIEIIN